MSKIKSILKAVLGRRIRRLPYHDEFQARLPSAIVGANMLHEGNPYLFDWAIQHMPDQGAVLEIGSYGGLSTNLLIHFLRKYNKNNPFFTCDAWVYEGYRDAQEGAVTWMDGRTDVSRVDFMAHIKASFIQSTRLLSADRLPYTIHARSADFLVQWTKNEPATDVFGRTVQLGGDLAFAYIDGDHSYATAAMEFRYIDACLLPGGVLLLDDSGRGMPFGSVQLAEEIRHRSDYRLVARNPNVMFQKLR
jgi:Methyltransferase domain